MDESLLAKIGSLLALTQFLPAQIESAPAKIESALAKIELLPAKIEPLAIGCLTKLKAPSKFYALLLFLDLLVQV
jgi:hypothetical protein